MKITCTNCKKKFDNEKYYGICPKCGAFNRVGSAQAEDHQRYHELYDAEDVHSEYEMHGKYHENYDNSAYHTKVTTAGGGTTNTAPGWSGRAQRGADEGAKKVVRIVRWVIIIAFIVNFLMGFIVPMLVMLFGEW